MLLRSKWELHHLLAWCHPPDPSFLGAPSSSLPVAHADVLHAPEGPQIQTLNPKAGAERHQGRLVYIMIKNEIWKVQKL